MQTYLYRAITTFLFPMGLFLASLMFAGHQKNRVRLVLGWLGGLAGCYVLCVLFHWLKSLIFAAAPIQAEAPEYYVSFQWFANNYLMNFGIKLLMFLAVTGILHFANGLSWKEARFASCTAVAAENLATVCFEIVVVRYGISSAFILNVLTQSAGNMILYILLHALIILLCWWFFIHRLPDEYIGEMPRGILHIVMIITVAAIFSSCVAAPPTESEYMSHVVLLITQMILCFTILVLEFYVIRWFAGEFEQSQMRSMMIFQQRHFEMTRESMENVNRNAHDMKYKIRALMTGISKGEAGSIQSELSDIQDSIRAWDAIYHTGSQALDIVLSEKAMVCNQEAVQFSVIADGRAVAFMNDTDIYTLFGNALDNALEAVRKLEDPSERLISLSVRSRGGFALVHIENSFTGDVQFRDGELQTSKQDKMFHGFGVRSIRSIAEKYGGRVTLSTKARLFTLDVVIPEA